MMDIVLPVFVTMFVIIDPLGLTPMFIGLTQGATDDFRRKMAVRGVAFGAGILLFFALIGPEFLGLLGIDMASFRIAGGVMLFLTGLEMVFGQRTTRRNAKAQEIVKDQEMEDVSVFPIAIPFIAGPGAITSIMLLMERHGQNLESQALVLGVTAGVLLIVLMFFVMASRLEKVFGDTVTAILTRILGVLLAALASQYILDGVRDALFQ